VSLNAEKTRLVTITDPGASFAFLGFELRWERSPRTGRWYASGVPRPKKVIAIQREVGEILRRSRHLPIQAAAPAQVNPVLRGWVNYFRVGNSGRAFDKVKYEVERKVRRLAAKKCKRKGFGWKRWSTTAWCTGARKHAPAERTHNPDGRRLRGEP
jgi:RNA-directed DNA polymerase